MGSPGDRGVPGRVVAASERLTQDLADARAGNYYEHGWYAYMRRWDIETLIEFVEEERRKNSGYLSLLPVD